MLSLNVYIGAPSEDVLDVKTHLQINKYKLKKK